ncbi:5-carboxymethyl-2-hydroxymuconate isomerase [Aquitalea sp. FJL05]|uniref:5-carboxymethyl-2-hydroxymuconate Delta-isomerase n=1 Tax=Aquitalea sp. FJL05 TaxID=2153366 RepID=UPI000F5988F9|nr:5-carboxymethyl-2-hydroxymuconate Delta-isomerase [Aquitalea sp. FJL05]RQO76977.1 5-carboxymethyl-2-hydroxymuconate isomerase [Aquitalea sp. FJL05]
MPQIIMQYSKGLQLDVPATLLAINQTLLASGQFQAVDIKSRAIPLDCWLTGTEPGAHPFVHLQLHILTGRDLATRQQLSSSLLPVLQQQVSGPSGTQLCVEICQMEKESYSKLVL